MANNERVSQLNDLLALDIQSNDVFLVTDMSQRESKKMEVGQLLLFFESSGTFQAYHSLITDTASYIKASNIDGLIISNIIATQSISSSYSNFSELSSQSLNATTASYSSFCVQNMVDADTASFLIYSPNNGTASYAIKTPLSDVSSLSKYLYYDGINPNGTASYAINVNQSNYSLTSTSASHATLSDNSILATVAISSSWTTQCISSSYSLYSLTSSYSNYSPTTSYIGPGGNIDFTVLSSSYSKSGSYTTTSSYSKTASYIIGGSNPSSTVLGHTWNIVNPKAAFAYGNTLYVIAQTVSSTASMYAIDMKYNTVSVVPSASFYTADSYFWGRIFISNNDNFPHAIINTQTSIYNYSWNTNPSFAGLYHFSSSFTRGMQNYLPVYSDFSHTIQSQEYFPSYYALYGSSNATDKFPNFHLYYISESLVSGKPSYNIQPSSVMDISQCNNSQSLLQFYNNETTIIQNTLLWDYNYILGNYYVIDNSTGFMHVFTSSFNGSPTNNFTSSQLYYQGTYGVTLPQAEPWGNSSVDRLIVDYDQISGTEKGLIMVRYGHSGYGGTVSYIPWPEIGN